MSAEKLTWPDPSPPTEGVSPYDHVRAHGFTIEWKSWKDYPGYTLVRDVTDSGFIGTFDTLDEAKATAEALHPGGLRARIEALEAALRFYADQERWDEFRSDEQASAYDRNTGSELGGDLGARAREVLGLKKLIKRNGKWIDPAALKQD